MAIEASSTVGGGPAHGLAPAGGAAASGTAGRGPVRALMLAAGVGRRLSPAHAGPKVLLGLEGRSLLARHLDALEACGVSDVTIVVGHEAGALCAALPPGRASVLHNPDFREGSVVSLWAGRSVLEAGAPVLLMDADVLYDRRVLQRLLASPHPDCMLLDREMEPGDEPVKLCVRGEREIVDFRKRPEVAHDWHGESVGFFLLSPATAAELARRADEYVRGGRRHMEYEEPLRDMILQHPGRFAFEDVTGLPWTEIDFPEDVRKAHALLPELAA